MPEGTETSTRNLDYSRPLDVHRWSEHPEVNGFVDAIYAEHFEQRGKVTIKKKHLKVLLLDLYVLWTTDPEMNLAVSRNRNDYEAGTRYNSLNISSTTIDIIDRLVEVGLIEQAKGFLDRNTASGRLTRIWPTRALILNFMNARFSQLDVGLHEGRETVVLRDGENEIEYEDTPHTRSMRELLTDYNHLLSRTFIDIPELDRPAIEMNNSSGRSGSLHVSQSDKFVVRIFNRGDTSFSKGGRFFGGWWQRCPKEWRKKIFIDDSPTNEIDYSGLHLVLLYALRGIDYWTEIDRDPYGFARPNFLESEEQARDYYKKLILIALNSSNEEEAFGAFRGEAATGTRAKHLTNEQLSAMLSSARELHSPIAEDFAADVAIRLMNIDSNMAEQVIRRFVDRRIPILTIHDSFIVPSGEEEFLRQCMIEAFASATGFTNVEMKALGPEFSEQFSWRETPSALNTLPPGVIRLQRRGRSAASIARAQFSGDMQRTSRSAGYVHRRGQFASWLQGS